MSLDIVIAKFLECDVSELGNKMMDSDVRDNVIRKFRPLRVFTLYQNRKNRYKEFHFQFISTLPASILPAYGNKWSNNNEEVCKKSVDLQLTVAQHYDLVQGIKLKYPENPCIIDFINGENYYYPIELVALVPHQPYYPKFGMRSMKTLESKHFRRGRDFRRYLKSSSTSRVIRRQLPQKIATFTDIEKKMPGMLKMFKNRPVDRFQLKGN